MNSSTHSFTMFISPIIFGLLLVCPPSLTMATTVAPIQYLSGYPNHANHGYHNQQIIELEGYDCGWLGLEQHQCESPQHWEYMISQGKIPKEQGIRCFWKPEQWNQKPWCRAGKPYGIVGNMGNFGGNNFESENGMGGEIETGGSLLNGGFVNKNGGLLNKKSKKSTLSSTSISTNGDGTDAVMEVSSGGSTPDSEENLNMLDTIASKTRNPKDRDNKSGTDTKLKLTALLAGMGFAHLSEAQKGTFGLVNLYTVKDGSNGGNSGSGGVLRAVKTTKDSMEWAWVGLIVVFILV